MKTILIITVFIFFSTSSFPQLDNDTSVNSDNFVKNKDLLKVPTNTTFYTHTIIPDSIYIKRLAALPFAFRMDYNPVTKRYIELFTVKIKGKFQVLLGLSDFYFPIFNEIFLSHNLPNELKYISIIESALNPIAVSPAHAVGLWQFIKVTGKENGLIINNYVDQRRGIIESTHAAAKYLKRLYTIYKDWQLVLAAYNCGPGNVNKAIHRARGKRDFWEIYKYLPRETRGYVPEFIGAAYAFNYYKEHNILSTPMKFPLITDTVLIYNKLHLQQVSKILGVPPEILKYLNPKYIQQIVPANEKTNYFIRIPQEQKQRFIELMDSIYTYDYTFYDKKLPELKKIQAHKRLSPGNASEITHHVKFGESIWSIANQYNVTINDIKDWNNISGSRIKQGQKLIVYPKGVTK